MDRSLILEFLQKRTKKYTYIQLSLPVPIFISDSFLVSFVPFFFLIFFLTEEPCNKYSTQESKTSCDVMSPHLFCFVLFFFYQLHWEKPKKIIM